MATRDKKLSVLDRIRAALKGSTTDSLTKDQVAKLVADAEKEDKEDGEEKSTKDAIAGFQKTIDGLPGMIAAAVKDAMKSKDGDDEDDEMTEDADGDKDDETEEEKAARLKKEKTEDAAGTGKTVDAATMRDVMQTVRAHAEILAPGTSLNMPTQDAKLSRVKFSDSMCNCKRKALDVAYRTEDGRAAIEPFLSGRTADFARMSAKTVDVIFTGAAVMRGAMNNDKSGKGLRAGITKDDFGRVPITIDALNTHHKEFWANQHGAKK